MRKEAADLDVDLEGLLIALLHRGLDDLEALGELHRLRELEAVLLREPVDGLLRERHRAYAGIAGPLALRRVRVEVDRRERELGDAARHATLHIDVADRLGGTHRHAENALLAHRDHAGKRRDVTVVVNRERNAPVLLDAVEHVLRRLELLGVLRLHTAEQRGDAHLLADERTRRGTADRIDTRKRRRGFLETRGELLVVILGIGLRNGIPRELLREDDLALVERGDLEVGRAKVEADAAAVRDGLHLLELLVELRHLLERDDDRLDGTPVDGREEVIVEFAKALLRVGLGDGLHDRVGTREIELPAAGSPERKLRNALDDVTDELRSGRIEALRHRQVITEDLALFALPRN